MYEAELIKRTYHYFRFSSTKLASHMTTGQKFLNVLLGNLVLHLVDDADGTPRLLPILVQFNLLAPTRKQAPAPIRDNCGVDILHIGGMHNIYT